MPVANKERIRRPGSGSTPSSLLGIIGDGPPTPPPDPLELTSAAAAAAAAAVAAFRLSPNSCNSPNRRNQEADSSSAATASKKRRHDGSVVQDAAAAAFSDFTRLGTAAAEGSAADSFQAAAALAGSRPGSRFSSVSIQTLISL